MKRPRTLVYGLDDRPPPGVTLLSGVQHAGLVSIFLLVPVLAAREAGLGPEKILDLLSLSMLVMAVGPLLQTYGRGPVGSGFLCPPIFAAAYLPASMIALRAGGLPLMFGMTVFAGCVEIVLSRLLRPLRPLFPPEIAGFVVMMIGLTIGTLGFRAIFAGAAAADFDFAPMAVSALTLGTMVGLNVWTRGALKLFCALIGMVVGYSAAVAAGLMRSEDLARLSAAPMVALPSIDHLGLAFDATLAVPFVVGALAACMRAMGDVTICQKSNDADWVRPDMRSISGGAMANGIGTVLAGLAGSVGLNTSTSNVGLAGATGVTSRSVAAATGGVFLLLAFLPKAGTIFAIMPGPVVGATLVFVSCMVFVNGLLIVTARMLDSRRTFVIGLSFMLGLFVDVFPGLVAKLPAQVHLLTSSSLVLGTLSALLLNLVFRIGVRRTQTLVIDPAHPEPERLGDFLAGCGAVWGARHDVIARASFNLQQSVEALLDSGAVHGPLDVSVSFDEFRLDVNIAYDGPPLELPERRPSNEEILASDEGARRLAGFLLRSHADRVECTARGTRSSLRFHFDH